MPTRTTPSKNDGSDDAYCQWDQAVLDLMANGGMATIDLPPEISNLHKECFLVARQALDSASSASGRTSITFPLIDPDADSSHVTGYHKAGSLSRYNQYREGFVFSDGQYFDVPLSELAETTTTTTTTSVSFESTMKQMFESMHDHIAQEMLKAIARYLLKDSTSTSTNDIENWFQDNMGPTGTASQWHVKRYVAKVVSNGDKSNSDTTTTSINIDGEENKDNDNDDNNWLPVHTDPSLISIVLHDVPGKKEGGNGLQYQAPPTKAADEESDKGSKPKRGEWKEVSAHGHSVATIFVGSVLSYITGGVFPSCKHKVVQTPESSNQQRTAATLFVRPQGNALLQVPPSAILLNGDNSDNDRIPVRIRKNVKFHDWLARVSKNYGKTKKKQKPKQIKKKSDDSTYDINDEEANPMYWTDSISELSLHSCTPPLSGQEKYLGGEVSLYNQHIYTIPGHATQVLDMDVTVEPPLIKPIGPVMKGEFKWLRGIPIGEYIYGIPCHAASVLKINTKTNEVELLRWEYEGIEGASRPEQKWKYHGGAVAPHDGCIYCIPQAAERVLKINPVTDEISFIGPIFPGVNKWYGGLVGKHDGAIYGICQNATGVLRIDPVEQNATIHGNYPCGGYKWHGAVNHPDGNVYGIPAHADTVLKLIPGPKPQITTIGGPIRTGAHRTDGKYKFLGGVVGGDNKVYFFPSDADYVCQIDPETDEVREVGPNLRDIEDIHNNKWQNGLTTQDGTIYGIPLKGSKVIRIVTSPKDSNGGSTEPQITTVGGPYTGLNKWEGGVTAANGDMYCMPLNCNHCLRIRHKGIKQ